MPGTLGHVAGHIRVDRSGTGPKPTAEDAVPTPLAVSSRALRTGAARYPWPAWSNSSSPSLLGEEKTQDVLLIGLCTAFSLIGWLMIAQGGEQIHSARATAKWPTTVGTIASVDMQEVDGSEGARWRPQVIYYYSVNGRVIASTRLTHGQAPHIGDEQAARAFLSRYPPQASVTVHYNPAEVTDSVLEPGTPRGAHLNLALGLVLAAIGPILLLLFGAPIYRRLKPFRAGRLTPTPPAAWRGLAPAARSSNPPP